MAVCVGCKNEFEATEMNRYSNNVEEFYVCNSCWYDMMKSAAKNAFGWF